METIKVREKSHSEAALLAIIPETLAHEPLCGLVGMSRRWAKIWYMSTISIGGWT